jgi:3-phenylpropionate/trans-cinnamate dioxygenase ferredoxin reductase subunit
VTFRLGVRVVRVDVGDHRVRTEDGESHGYGRLLLATGGEPRRLPGWGDAVRTFRSMEDYLALRQAAAAGKEILVVGGGFVGAELAAALTGVGAKVTMVFPEEAILARILPRALSARVTEIYRRRGVAVLAGETLARARRDGEGVRATFGGGREARFDYAVAGIGVAPSLELAREAGIATSPEGVLVDESLRTSAPDVFAAGDMAAFFSPPLGRRLRVEHEQAAVDQGRTAGLAMAGREARLEPLPLFYSDLFDDGFEAVGVLDSRLPVVVDGDPPYDTAVAYYLEDDRVVGVLLWNLWDRIEEARAVIREGRVPAEKLKGRIR